MNKDFERAKKLLKAGKYTCVLCKGEQVYTSCRRGVAPLLDWLEQGNDYTGFCAADKVVGRAAAFLYQMMGVTRLYAEVVSQLALEVLEQSGIACEYGQLVPAIRNRSGDGFCPMESAVRELNEPEKALAAIKQTQKNFLGR